MAADVYFFRFFYNPLKEAMADAKKAKGPLVCKALRIHSSRRVAVQSFVLRNVIGLLMVADPRPSLPDLRHEPRLAVRSVRGFCRGLFLASAFLDHPAAGPPADFRRGRAALGAKKPDFLRCFIRGGISCADGFAVPPYGPYDGQPKRPSAAAVRRVFFLITGGVLSFERRFFENGGCNAVYPAG